MPGIFISYRRDDAAPYAGRLYDRLTREFAHDEVFMDIDSLRPGEDFVDAIDTRLEECRAVIALIGRRWASVTDATTGMRRLDDPADYVRRELAAALERKLLVIPVLVAGAAMPRADELPDDLKPLLRRQAIELSDTRFQSDASRLIDALATTARPKATPGSAPRRTWLIGGAVAGLALAALAFWWPGRDIPTPDLSGKPREQAESLLNGAGLVVGKVSAIETESVADGKVVSQTPAPGARVRKGSAVELMIAVVPRVAVPNVIDASVARAKDRLTSVGLTLGTVEWREPGAAPTPGMVLSQTPPKDTRVARGDAVALVAAPLAVLPELRGKPADDARKAVAALGLRIGKVETRRTAQSPVGQVIEQRPAAGEKLSIESRVDLVIATAMPDVDLPDLSKLRLSQALDALARAGLVPGQVKRAGLHTEFDVAEPIVRSQSPAARTAVKPGARVELTVAEPGARVPELTGMSLDRARAQLKQAGLMAGSLGEDPVTGTPAGWVTAQQWAAGRVVARGSAVDLTVSSAKASTPPAAGQVRLPNVVGWNWVKASDRLHSLGLRRVNGRAISGSGKSGAEVIRQTPAADSTIGVDDPVLLEYAAAGWWLDAPGEFADAAQARLLANKECPGVCKRGGGRWAGLFSYKTVVSCGCDK